MEAMIGRDGTLSWAHFSGDFNPIHFDVEMARVAGSDELIVHGMNALLHVKQAVDRREQREQREWRDSSVGESAGWRQFKVVFRRPVPQERTVSIDIETRDGVIAFAVRDLGGAGGRFFKGVCGPAEAPLPSGVDEGRLHVTIEPQRLQAKFEEFAQSFPFVSRPWIFLDALVFSDFLAKEFPRMSLDFERGGVSSVGTVVVQMSHRVLYDAMAIDRLFARTEAFPRLTYTVARPNSFTQPGGAFGTVEITVSADERVVLQEEIGLISRDVSR